MPQGCSSDLRKPTSPEIALSRADMEALTWLLACWGRSGGRSSRTVAAYILNHPGLASCGCGTSGTLSFPQQFISHRMLQGWIKLLKTLERVLLTWGPGSCNPRCCRNCKLTRMASCQQGKGTGHTVTRRCVLPFGISPLEPGKQRAVGQGRRSL